MLRLLCLLALVAPAIAEEPAKSDRAVEAVVSDLVELRQQVGGVSDSFPSREGFAEALRGVVQNAPAPATRPDPRMDSFPSPNFPQRGRHFDPSLTPVPRDRRVVDPYPQFSNEAFSSRAEQEPAVQLRLKAFDLDRMAHDLEMADLGAEADAVREAAQKLRASAREMISAAKADPGPAAGVRGRLRSPSRVTSP